MRKVKILSNEQDQCPYCNGMDIDYGCIQLEDDMVYYPAHCNECGRDFEEWYDLTFTGHNVGDGCCEEAADLIGEEIEMDEPDDEDEDDDDDDEWGENVLETKESIEKYKENICSKLKERIKGYNLYHSLSEKSVFKGKIIDCRVKCFKEYLGTNSVAVDIITERDGKTLVTQTFIHCIYSQNVGFDYFIEEEREDE